MGGRRTIGRRRRAAVPEKQWGDWKWQLQNRVRLVADLASVMNVPAASLTAWRPVMKAYPVAITPYYLSLLDPSDERDPLRRQCFPDPRELDFSPWGSADPLNEEGAMPVPGLIRRYPDRCLAIVVGACAVYCRHCNRKRMWHDKKGGGLE